MSISSLPITLIDYGTSNLGSLHNMLKKIGIKSTNARTPEEVMSAKKIILPGIGSFDKGMEKLHASNMVNALHEKVMTQKIPTLGICLGMQMMGKTSEEGNDQTYKKGLGWLDFKCKKFDRSQNQKMRIPHMGWNAVTASKQTTLSINPPEDWRYYFAHSYHACDHEKDLAFLTTQYCGVSFASGLMQDNIYAVQFHPEKSHHFGLWLLTQFGAINAKNEGDALI